MSSPPYSATSPPYSSSPTYPPSLSLPKKRPSLGQLGASNSKRRKPSSVASSSHPLRQTSFPPPEGRDRRVSYSPTIEGSVSSVGVPSKRGRGRPRKNRGSADAVSTAGASGRDGKTSGATHRDTNSLANGAAGSEEDNDDDDDDDGQENAVLEGGGTMGEASQKQDKENLAMLLQAFDREQTDRYEVWRRVRLKKEIVRRITNQTLSQSVPQSVVIAINGITKVFIGEIVERARDVQTHWMASSQTLPTGKPNLGEVEERDRGPLTPDHLREALRLYKKDEEGGGAGLQGLSLQGKETVAARTRGKRLFR